MTVFLACVSSSNAEAYSSLVELNGARYGVDADLIRAIIAKESCWNPNAIKNEPHVHDASRGLMQVLYATAQSVGYSGEPEGLFDPATNIEAGTRYLAQQLARYGDVGMAISAYNAGSATVKNRAYVDDVLGYYTAFRGKALGPGAPPPAPSPAPSQTLPPINPQVRQWRRVIPWWGAPPSKSGSGG